MVKQSLCHDSDCTKRYSIFQDVVGNQGAVSGGGKGIYFVEKSTIY